jgi:hypothetical protein
LKRVGVLATLWCVAILPAGLGWQRCALATLFHVPCPGCGMTRAIALLAAGRVGESLRMNALAVPVLGAGVVLVAATLVATYRYGTPFDVHRTRLGRAAIGGLGVAYCAAVVLWVMRWFAWFGGPVAIG